tara:strand:+ start:110 stop:385 length:276 start_codon:yes stop_codon:yes gene_type:complete
MNKKEVRKILKDYKDYLNKTEKGLFVKLSDYSLDKYIKEQLTLSEVSRSAKIKINEPFEIEETGEKYVAEINNFEDKNGLWDKETIIVKID